MFQTSSSSNLNKQRHIRNEYERHQRGLHIQLNNCNNIVKNFLVRENSKTHLEIFYNSHIKIYLDNRLLLLQITFTHCTSLNKFILCTRLCNIEV